MRQRYDWIDFAKGVGIILVVYGHTLRGLVDGGEISKSSPIFVSDYVIYTFHMPLFFFLSGVLAPLSLTKGTGRFLKSRFKAIIYPYFLWSLALGGMQIVLSGVANHSVTPSRLLTILWQPISPFWFLWSLFWIQVLYAVLHNVRPAPLVIIAAACFIVAQFGAPYPIAYTVRGFFYFALGCYASHALFSTNMRGPVPEAPMLIGLFSLFLVTALGFDRLNINFAVATLPALLGIAFVILLGMRFAPQLPFLAWIGNASLGIYVMHTLVTAGVRILMAREAGVSNGLILLTAGTLAGTLLPLAVLVMASRWGINGVLGLPKLAPYPEYRCKSLTNRNSLSGQAGAERR